MMAAPQTAPKRVSVARERKMRMAADFEQLISGCEAVLAAHYDGLAVAELDELRAAAREVGGSIRVVKKTVAGRVLAATGDFAPLAERLDGQLLFAAAESAPALAKTLRAFAGEHEALRLAGGAMQGSYLDAAQCEALATLPGRGQLLAQLAGALAAPAGKLARTLAAVPAGLARAIAAVRDKGDGGSASQDS